MLFSNNIGFYYEIRFRSIYYITMLLRRSNIQNKKKPAKKVKKLGRPSSYTDKIGKYICREIMKGRTLTSICKEEGMPSIPTVYNWLNRLSKAHNEIFLKSYKEAREIQAEVLADEIKDISDDIPMIDDPVNVSRARLQSDNRKWLAAHLLPRKFSDRVQLTGAEGKDLIPSIPTKVVFNFVGEEEGE
jgi:hypothetical protein